MLISLVDGIIEALPKLVEAIPEIIMTIVTSLITNFPKIIESGKKITESLGAGIVSLVWKIGEACVKLGMAIGEELKKLPSKAIQWGVDFVMGLINGIKSMIGSVGNAVSGIANKIKSFLHFSRPDEGPLRDYETWMPDMIKGLSDKMNQNAPKLYEASKDLARKVAEGLDVSKMVDGTSVGINTTVTSNAIDTLANGVSSEDNSTPINLTVNVGNETLYKGMQKSRSQASNQYGVTV